jgi:uncharacterized membrane protein
MQMDAHQNTPQAPWWRSASGLVLIGFLAVGGFFLIAEHRAHVFGVLPYLLILACPLMHLFHRHGGHGVHGQAKHQGHDDPSGKAGQ